MTKTKTVIQKSNRNLLSYVSNSRRETWASLNLKTEIAKTLKDGVSRLDHPNNHKFRDNTPDDMKKNIYLRTYKPEKIKCFVAVKLDKRENRNTFFPFSTIALSKAHRPIHELNIRHNI